MPNVELKFVYLDGFSNEKSHQLEGHSSNFAKREEGKGIA